MSTTATSMPVIGEPPTGVDVPESPVLDVGTTRVTIHVAQDGDDANGGTSSDDALATIQAGVDRAEPGDVVLVGPGTYAGGIEVEVSGEPGAWITIRSSEPLGASVVIPDGFEYEAGFSVGGSYIRIEGFEVSHEANGEGAWGGGIVVRDAHHTWVVDNLVHDVGGSGISFLQSDYSFAEGNTVSETSNWSPHQTSGINIYQARAFDDEPGIHNVIRGNVSFAVANRVPRDDEGTTDGNGIIVDDLRNDFAEGFEPYAFGTLVENNLVFGNGGKGIHVFQSDHVLVRNNTAFGNNLDALNPSERRGELSSNRASDVTWVNNIAIADPGAGVLAYNVAISVTDSELITILSNLIGSTGGSTALSLGSERQLAYMGDNLVGLDPLFVDASGEAGSLDFSVLSASPAIDAGTDLFGVADRDLAGIERIIGDAVDIGAYEHPTAGPSASREWLLPAW